MKGKMEEEARESVKSDAAIQEMVDFARKSGNKQQLKSIRETLKSIRKNRKKNHAMTYRMHQRMYCNVGCKDTIVEKGGTKKFPAGLLKRHRKNPSVIAWLKEQRSDIFGDADDVLLDNFPKSMTNSRIVKELKRKGAISYCSPPPPPPRRGGVTRRRRGRGR